MSNQVIVSALVLFAWSLFAQEATPNSATREPAEHAAEGTIPLRSADKVVISTERNRPLYRPARCDQKGNIYFRAYQEDDRKVPVTRVDDKGVTTKYEFSTDPAFLQGVSYDFSVLPNGDLYQPVQVGKDVYIVGYNGEGKIRCKTKLEKQFWVSHLAAVSDDSFLVSGTELQNIEPGKERQSPQLVLALFDNSGRIVRRISLESNQEKPKTAESNKEKMGTDGGAGRDAQANRQRDGTTMTSILQVLEGNAQTDAGGNTYLLLHTDIPIAYVLDSHGKVERSFAVRPPGARMRAISFSVAKDRLAVFFRESFRGMTGMPGMAHEVGIVTIVDAANGAVLANYSVGPGLSEILACYRQDDFAFITPEKASLAIQHATPQHQ